jgi:hypothetical protein
MLLLLDNIPFQTAVKIIEYCHEHSIDKGRSSVYYTKIKGRPVDLGDQPWELELPDHLLTWFRMKYGGLE